MANLVFQFGSRCPFLEEKEDLYISTRLNMVAATTVKIGGGKVFPETSDRTVINIHITKKSWLDSLLDAIKTIKAVRKDGQGITTSNNVAHSGEPLVAGVSFISLGSFGVLLAIIIAIVQPNLDIFVVGAHFWVGIPFIISGVLNIFAYEKPKAFWVVITFISLLGCLTVTIAGLVFVHTDITSYWSRNNMAPFCDKLIQSSPDAETIQYLKNCKSGFQQYQNTLYGLLVMSSIVMACGLCICLIAMDYRLKMVFSYFKHKIAEEEKDNLLTSNLSQNLIDI